MKSVCQRPAYFHVTEFFFFISKTFFLQDIKLKVLPKLVPEGQEDAATIILGTFVLNNTSGKTDVNAQFYREKPLAVQIWKEIGSVFVNRQWISDQKPREISVSVEKFPVLDENEVINMQVKISTPYVVNLSSTGIALKHDDYNRTVFGDYNLIPNHNYPCSLVYQKDSQPFSFLYRDGDDDSWYVSWNPELTGSKSNELALRNKGRSMIDGSIDHSSIKNWVPKSKFPAVDLAVF